MLLRFLGAGAPVAELVDAPDSKSGGFTSVLVRVRPGAPSFFENHDSLLCGRRDGLEKGGDSPIGGDTRVPTTFGCGGDCPIRDARMHLSCNCKQHLWAIVLMHLRSGLPWRFQMVGSGFRALKRSRDGYCGYST